MSMDRTYLPFVASMFKRSIGSCTRSMYFWSCLVYFLYAVVYVRANISSYGDRSDSVRTLFNLYLASSIGRVVASYMFLSSWRRRTWLDPILFPEYLNIASAQILLVSVVFYGTLVYPSPAAEANSKLLDCIAWTVHLLASVGWALTWYYDYYYTFGIKPMPTPNRGFTLDDPDILANLFNLASALAYALCSATSLLVHSRTTNNYNIINNNNSSASTEQSYPFSYPPLIYVQVGDTALVTSAFLYVLCALRDGQFFWFMPSWGHFKSIDEIIKGEKSNASMGSPRAVRQLEIAETIGVEAAEEERKDDDGRGRGDDDLERYVFDDEIGAESRGRKSSDSMGSELILEGPESEETDFLLDCGESRSASVNVELVSRVINTR